jgi:integrase
VSPSLFDEMVKDGRMPAPKRINSRIVWDRRQLDRAFDDLPGVGRREPVGRSGRVGSTMVNIRLKYVVEDVDRHGNVRVYVRLPGRPKIRLRAAPGTREFMEAYQSALSAAAPVEARTNKAVATKGSLKWLCEAYYSTSEYGQLDDRTKRVRRNILDDLCHAHGDKPADRMEPRHVRALRDAKIDRPEAANGILKALRQVFALGVANNLVNRNPARDVPYIRGGSQGFHSWTYDEIVAFETRHAVGTRARLALALLLYTGQRRSDVVRLGKQHVRDGWLCFTQHKNRRRKPVTLQIPIVPELQRIIDASPCGDLTFLVAQLRRPFTSAGFGNKFRQWCDEAGLQNCSAHGLRKAAAARLAEMGATEHEIMAVTGHRTSKEVARYTARLGRRRSPNAPWLGSPPIKRGTKMSHLRHALAKVGRKSSPSD